jgi:hypothetical protein
MTVIKHGCLVYVYDSGNNVIAQYDLRVKQDVQDIFQPTGYTGKPLQVEICILGGNGFNAIIVNDGSNKETYYL